MLLPSWKKKFTVAATSYMKLILSEQISLLPQEDMLLFVKQMCHRCEEVDSPGPIYDTGLSMHCCST